MDGPAVRSPRRGAVLDRFWPTPYPRCPEEMSFLATSTAQSPTFDGPQQPRSIQDLPRREAHRSGRYRRCRAVPPAGCLTRNIRATGEPSF